SKIEEIASGDSTLLYDSISNIITSTFHQNAGPSRPWVLIIVTDRDDNLSTMNSRQFSRVIYDKFTKEESHFMFVVGVGNHVNENKMQAVSHYFHYIYY